MALIICRKPGQSLDIQTSDGPITITFERSVVHKNGRTKPMGNRCKVVIDAPADVKILRGELVKGKGAA
jgi:hypothetical protein